MPTTVDAETCTGCEACVDACPVEAISMQDDIAVVDADSCTDCESCVEVCDFDAITVEEGQSYTFPTSFLLENDDNSDQLTVIGVGSEGRAEHGTVVLEGNRVTYTPDPDYSGPDSFNYIVETVDGLTASATVNVTVTPVQDPPTISDIPDQVITQGESTGALVFTVSDPDTAPADLEVLYRVINTDPANLTSIQILLLLGTFL